MRFYFMQLLRIPRRRRHCFRHCCGIEFPPLPSPNRPCVPMSPSLLSLQPSQLPLLPYHHCVVIVNGGGKDSSATTTIDHHRCTTAVGSVPELHPTTTTATLALIALALALPRRRIERQGGECATTRLIHCCCGRCFWHCLHLCLQDNGAKEEGHGNRGGRYANIRGREEVGHHNPICPCTCRQLSWALLYVDAAPHITIAAGLLHVLHVILNLIVASFALVLDNR